MYNIRILEEASRELARLDKPVGRRIVERINWLSQKLNDIRPEPLKGDLIGLYKFRIGDYRVIYEIDDNQKVVSILHVGYRKSVYL